MSKIPKVYNGLEHRPHSRVRGLSAPHPTRPQLIDTLSSHFTRIWLLKVDISAFHYFNYTSLFLINIKYYQNTMGYSRKKNPRLRIYFFEPAPVPWSFRFATLPLKVPEETSSHPWNYAKFCDTPSNFECQKPRPIEIQQEFLVNSLGNSTPF